MHRVEITFGHHSNGKLLPREQIAEVEWQTLNTFTKAFQGGQLLHRLGGYLSDSQMTLEPCTVIWALVEEVEEYLGQLWVLAASIASQLNQECVLLTVSRFDGLVGFVKPGDKGIAPLSHSTSSAHGINPSGAAG